MRTRKSLGSGEFYNFVTSGTFLNEKLIFMDYWYVLRTSHIDFPKFRLCFKIQPTDFLRTDFAIFRSDVDCGTARTRVTTQEPNIHATHTLAVALPPKVSLIMWGRAIPPDFLRTCPQKIKCPQKK